LRRESHDLPLMHFVLYTSVPYLCTPRANAFAVPGSLDGWHRLK
jgi:hypothetical protein